MICSCTNFQTGHTPVLYQTVLLCDQFESFCQVGANVRTKSLGFFAVHIGNERGATHLQMIERHNDTNVDLVG